MDEEYDVVVCGTGLKECILSGLLTCEGKRVLHLDRNGYYGGESASLNLTNLYSKFRGPGVRPPESMGANRDWNVDLIPKFLMANGLLVKCLITTRVARYLEWVVVDGTYVYQHQKGSWVTAEKHIHKVPGTPSEALSSNLVGILEKKRLMDFLNFVAKFNPEEPKTYSPFNLETTSMKEVYKHYGFSEDTIEFIGHSIALYPNEGYADRPCGEAFERLLLYVTSIAKHGTSPFVYPLYGLGGICEGYSRLAAVHGGVYMLNTPIDSFKYGPDGAVEGVQHVNGTITKCKTVVCDPSYMNPNDVKMTGKIIRAVLILSAPPKETGNKHSCQIIIPQHQVNRNSDIYITVVSSNHGVCLKGKFVAVIATEVETEDPEAELKPAFDIMGPIEERFINISEYYVPNTDMDKTKVYCSQSFDATSHFETTMQDVLGLFKQITGKELDMAFDPNLNDSEC